MARLHQLIIGSRNKGKLREIQDLLSETDIHVQLLSDVGVADDREVEETGATFVENATLKATSFAQYTHLPTLADDSGLAVEALNGAPGVYSKRYAPGSDHDRNQHLLAAMAGQTNRKARFVSVICLYDPASTETYTFTGEVTGTIADTERGQNGFGYDPLFIPDGYTQTFAELGDTVKNTISHRARALAKLKEFLLK